MTNKVKGLLNLMTILVGIAILTSVSFAQGAPIKKKEVLKIMERVADWQLQSMREKKPWNLGNWEYAVGYTGIYELSKMSKSYRDNLIEIGEKLNWKTGRDRFHADDYCIGQLYSLLYMQQKDEKFIANFKGLADSIVTMPHTESLAWKNKIASREWAWCDALFMGPPALGYLSTATGDMKYLDMATKLWWKTTDYLYDTSEHLYFRDQSNFKKREQNGAKVFWSRGNGWVIAGLVRLLQNMPANYEGRQRFEQLLKEYSVRIIQLQQEDGTWHSSLLAPNIYPNKESSGTGLICYALMWGVNNGQLDAKTYLPVIYKSWTALTTCVGETGKLGYVQQVADSPGAVDENSTKVYGVGAFLLAGSEIYKYLEKHKKFAF